MVCDGFVLLWTFAVRPRITSKDAASSVARPKELKFAWNIAKAQNCRAKPLIFPKVGKRFDFLVVSRDMIPFSSFFHRLEFRSRAAHARPWWNPAEKTKKEVLGLIWQTTLTGEVASQGPHGRGIPKLVATLLAMQWSESFTLVVGQVNKKKHENGWKMCVMHSFSPWFYWNWDLKTRPAFKKQANFPLSAVCWRWWSDSISELSFGFWNSKERPFLSVLRCVIFKYSWKRNIEMFLHPKVASSQTKWHKLLV